MKKIIVFICTVLICTGCAKPPEQIAVVRLKFEGFENSDMAHISIFETKKNDTTIHLDTIIYNYVLNETNGYQFELRFKTETNNGDFVIIADSVSGINLISEVEVKKDFSFKYLFNSIPKTEKDKYLIITKNS